MLFFSSTPFLLQLPHPHPQPRLSVEHCISQANTMGFETQSKHKTRHYYEQKYIIWYSPGNGFRNLFVKAHLAHFIQFELEGLEGKCSKVVAQLSKSGNCARSVRSSRCGTHSVNESIRLKRGGYKQLHIQTFEQEIVVTFVFGSIVKNIIFFFYLSLSG